MHAYAAYAAQADAGRACTTSTTLRNERVLFNERTGLVSVITPSGSALALLFRYGGCAGDVHCRVYTGGIGSRQRV